MFTAGAVMVLTMVSHSIVNEDAPTVTTVGCPMLVWVENVADNGAVAAAVAVVAVFFSLVPVVFEGGVAISSNCHSADGRWSCVGLLLGAICGYSLCMELGLSGDNRSSEKPSSSSSLDSGT